MVVVVVMVVVGQMVAVLLGVMMEVGGDGV